MSVDFPRAWQISASVPVDKHATLCSYKQSQGGILCDCDVLMAHIEVRRRHVLYTKDGVVVSESEELI